jgi:hypothetical protein
MTTSQGGGSEEVVYDCCPAWSADLAPPAGRASRRPVLLAARGTPLTLDKGLRHTPGLAVGVFFVGLVVVALMLLRSRLALAWHMPLWFAYYYTALLWGVFLAVMACVFSAATVIAFRTQHVGRWKIVLGGTLVLVTVHVVQWQFTRPVAPALTHVTLPDGVILQSSGESCAAAAGANIVRVFGMQKTEQEMAVLFGTTRGLGTSAAQVIYGMRTLGVAASKVHIPDADPARLTAPAMLFIDHPEAGPESHAVAYMGLANGQAEIWDSLVGKRWLDTHQLRQIWHGRGIVFQPQAGSRRAVRAI